MVVEQQILMETPSLRERGIWPPFLLWAAAGALIAASIATLPSIGMYLAIVAIEGARGRRALGRSGIGGAGPRLPPPRRAGLGVQRGSDGVRRTPESVALPGYRRRPVARGDRNTSGASMLTQNAC